MEILKGIAVSPGVAIGESFVVDDEKRRIARRTVGPERRAAERTRLEKALSDSVTDLLSMRDRVSAELGDEAGKIFAFHVGMLADKKLTRPMAERIERESVTAEYAVWAEFQALVERFAAREDPAFRTKVDDVHDLRERLLKHLIGEHSSRLAELNHRAVLVSSDLTPSQTAMFNRNHVLAIVTEMGGRTSHNAIFARALGIPAVMGCGGVMRALADGTAVIVDGDNGLVVVEPDAAEIEKYQRYIEQRRLWRLNLSEVARLPSVTKDGVHMELLGNIEFPEEAGTVIEMGGEGVGLYRTEFLYLVNNSEPTEEEHYAAYSECIRLLQGRMLTIRTVDLGADKYTQERAENPERNPFLGLRSIRYCLQSIPMFKRQLRAIVRASALGPVKVMFPLVTSWNEFRQASFLLRDVMDDLEDEGVKFDRNMSVGMMVEVPSAALMASVFAREANFFSIGTNDLVQYTLAVDRTNERVANMYNPAHPAVNQLVKTVVRAARRASIPVSCCGEAAAEPEYALLLMGLGVRTLSVVPSAIPQLKRLIRSVTVDECERLAQKVGSLDSDVAVTSFLRDQTRKILPEAFDGRSVGERSG